MKIIFWAFVVFLVIGAVALGVVAILPEPAQPTETTVDIPFDRLITPHDPRP